ncbi:two-component system histidine kinase PnpS [Loigolactobacillus iwatensis]|uniref:two-component system histidine kinase PnpS n=1 Tax=Loigolactobacillus iwatensis TaxID=1267156 RepID=UPI000F7EAA9C|nr:ATP-binding protein [Loigolactobacillus iwatensis]
MKQIRHLGELILGVIIVGVTMIILFLNQSYLASQKKDLSDKAQLFQGQTLTQMRVQAKQTNCQVMAFNRKNQLVVSAAGVTAREALPAVLRYQTTGKRQAIVQTRQQDQLVYLITKHDQTILLVQPKRNLWEPFWPHAAYVIGVTLGMIGLIVLVLLGHHLAVERSLKRLKQQLQQIKHSEKMAPALLKPTDRYFDLEQQIVQVNDVVGQAKQQELKRQTDFNQLLTQLTVGILLLDHTGLVVNSNPASAQLLETKIISRPHPYVNDIQDYHLSRLIKRALRDREAQHQEITLTLTKEQIVDVHVVWLTADRLAVLLYDVTEIKQIQQMQLDFVSNVSHELKTPVTAITGFTETLLAGAQNDPKDRQAFLEIIATESQRLTSLIQDIIALARGEQRQPKLTTFDVPNLIEQLLPALQPQIDAKRIQLKLDLAIAPNLKTDANQFEQIIKNLLVNAINYNRVGGQITLTSRLVSAGWQLKICDSGVGIASADQARVFERFYRVDKTRSRDTGGTGLGLAIVAALVTGLGGTIRLQSQLGVGSCFTVVLPSEEAGSE